LLLCAVIGAIDGQLMLRGDADDTPVTMTTLEHDPVRAAASVAEQFSGVVPTWNSDPDAGTQVVVTGAVPPATSAEKLTGTGAPEYEVAVGDGHEMVGAPIAPAPARPATSCDGMLTRRAASYDWTTK
jgi:hypothetical protein